MTLVGKIFTVLVLIMSVLFMGFAIVVFATHRNWRETAKGLESQIEELKKVNLGLRDELARAGDRLAIEQAARRFALAALQSRLDQLEQLLVQKESQLASLQATAGTTAETLRTNQENLAALTTEVSKLRDDVRNAQQARDEKFAEVVRLTDDWNKAQGQLELLDERNGQLLAQVSRMTNVLNKHDLNEFSPVDDIAPRVDGIVVAVGEKDLIEISIGSDDGLRKGHTLDVFRENSYLGRVIVVRTEPDRAVAEILKVYRRGIIKKGDRVATKLS